MPPRSYKEAVEVENSRSRVRATEPSPPASVQLMNFLRDWAALSDDSYVSFEAPVGVLRELARELGANPEG